MPDKLEVGALDDGRILTVTLNAPKGNVLDIPMLHEFIAFIEEAKQKPEARAILLNAQGKHFSFGASIEDHQPERVAEMLGTFHRMFKGFIDLAIPMVVVVQGQCLGGGLELASFCHWIFASTDAMLGQPEIKLGVFPPVASVVLPLRIGQANADFLCLTGESVDAEQAKKMGLVHDVSEDPQAVAEAFIREYLCPKSAESLRQTVRATRSHFHRVFTKEIDVLEREYLNTLMSTFDANEGIHAFLEKRKPVWKNTPAE